MDLQVLDNEASKEYFQVITQIWKVTFQLVPLDVHHRNAAEYAIWTVKAHFIAILADIAGDSLSYLWDTLLTHTKLTLNVLRQVTLAPGIST